MSDIQFYSGLHNGYEDFSNFTHAPFQATEYGQTVHFPTVEHYFHYQKAKLFGDETAKQAILNANDPLQAKRIGHTVQNFDPFVWDKVAQKHIANGMYLKFTQNPELKQKLIDTKDATLQEANPYDSKYGVGRDGQGQNLTGKCLMRVRDLIVKEQTKEQPREERGDITAIKRGYIMHQVNCQDVMGAGVAKALYTKYPQVKRAYHAFAKAHPTPESRFGLVQPVKVSDDLTICNSFTQFGYGNSAKTGKTYTDEKKLMDALSRFDARAKENNMLAYVPDRIGCGLAGGNWNTIKNHILNKTDITIVSLDQPEKAKASTKDQPKLSLKEIAERKRQERKQAKEQDLSL